jgi:2TM domain
MRNDQARAQAERRVRRKQGFRTHALAYALANSAMIAGWATTGGRFWPLWPLTGWGAGLLAHFSSAYRRNPVPERQIERELERSR